MKSPSLHIVFLSLFGLRCWALPTPGDDDNAEKVADNFDPASMVYLTTDEHPVDGPPPVQEVHLGPNYVPITVPPVSGMEGAGGSTGRSPLGNSRSKATGRKRKPPGEDPEPNDNFEYQYRWNVVNDTANQQQRDSDTNAADEGASFHGRIGHAASFTSSQIGANTGEALQAEPPQPPVRQPQREWHQIPRTEQPPRNPLPPDALTNDWAHIVDDFLSLMQFFESGNSFFPLGTQHHLRLGWWNGQRRDWDGDVIPTIPMNTLVVARHLQPDDATPRPLVEWLQRRLRSGDPNAMGGFLTLETVMYAQPTVFAFDYQVLDNDAMVVPLKRPNPPKEDPDPSDQGQPRRKRPFGDRDPDPDYDPGGSAAKLAKLSFVGWNTIDSPVFRPVDQKQIVANQTLVPRKDRKPIYIPMPELYNWEILQRVVIYVGIIFIMLIRFL